MESLAGINKVLLSDGLDDAVISDIAVFLSGAASEYVSESVTGSWCNRYTANKHVDIALGLA